MEFNLNPGMSYEIEKVVTSHDTASHMGSGEVSVFSTPSMILWMENAALNAVKSALPQGYDTVGTFVNISHLAATPVGMKVRVIAELTEVNGKMLTFKVKAYDEKDKIGEGTHGRAIVSTEKFLSKVNDKAKV
ncbi:MAG: thioesterase family protein [Lachnospiraceae bacterium]|nr:thioesterase family protein [Lachnospiraceae bacterium]